jgi:RNA polymerase sigma-70 factor (ECF subfamily)
VLRPDLLLVSGAPSEREGAAMTDVDEHTAAKTVGAEALFRDFAGALTGFMRARTGDDATAEDLVQEVFVRVHRSAGELRDSERVAGWVFQIARNVVADHYRRGDGRPDRQNHADAERHLGQAVDEGADLEAEGAATQNRQLGLWLAATIQTLPGPYREALTLVELEGLTQRQAAQRLGLSHSGLKSRVQRGRAMLRRALVRCCDVELDRGGRVIDYRERTAKCGASESCCP